MGELDKYLDKAMDLAEDAGEAAKTIAGEIAGKAKELTEEGSEARRIVESAKEQASSLGSGIREKVQGVVKDAKAGSEIAKGIEQLEALPEVEGSIVYRMELETTLNQLKSLQLVISDKRLDDPSVVEEIKEVMEKVKPAADAEPAEETAEQQAIRNVKDIAHGACVKALEALGLDA